MKTLSQISEYLYSTETALLREELTVFEAAAELAHARRYLEPHITPFAHGTLREGSEHYSLDGSPTEP